jgi:uncharacterized protein (DUF2252 family)
MARSAHAFVRGSTKEFYEWLEGSGRGRVPNGPPVWICGDCHVGNLGPVADSKGAIHIQIRDLDQTVVGNPNHDLIRLALSLASAARGSDLPGVTTAHMLEQMMRGYEMALRGGVGTALEKPESVRLVMHKAARRTWKHLAKERLKAVKPKIPRGDRFWSLSRFDARAVEQLFERNDVRRLITGLKGRSDEATIDVVDSAYWVKGCSSLGKLRVAVLLRLQDKKAEDGEYCLADIKEASTAAAPRAPGCKMPANNAKRVVQGAVSLSPALGERMLAAQLLKRSVFVRELMPQDMKVEIDQLTREEAVTAAAFLAGVVGRAHARQMDNATRREFLHDLKKRRSKRLEAPSWLWSSVVELAAAHEAAYLQHCRAYALN